MVVHPDSERVIDVAQAGFRRVLASWAMEVMSLRRRGLHRPAMLRGDTEQPIPKREPRTAEVRVLR